MKKPNKTQAAFNNFLHLYLLDVKEDAAKHLRTYKNFSKHDAILLAIQQHPLTGCIPGNELVQLIIRAEFITNT